MLLLALRHELLHWVISAALGIHEWLLMKLNSCCTLKMQVHRCPSLGVKQEASCRWVVEVHEVAKRLLCVDSGASLLDHIHCLSTYGLLMNRII